MYIAHWHAIVIYKLRRDRDSNLHITSTPEFFFFGCMWRYYCNIILSQTYGTGRPVFLFSFILDSDMCMPGAGNTPSPLVINILRARSRGLRVRALNRGGENEKREGRRSTVDIDIEIEIGGVWHVQCQAGKGAGKKKDQLYFYFTTGWGSSKKESIQYMEYGNFGKLRRITYNTVVNFTIW